MTHKAMQGGIFSLALFLLPCVGAHASIVYTAALTGAAENPANASLGSGSAMVEYDSIAHSLVVNVTFSDLTVPATAAHIHCCVVPPTNAAVAVPLPGFPSATSGSYNNTFDLTNSALFSAAFISANGGTVSGAEAALANGLANGQAYLNIHTSQYPGGEIRGYLAPVPIPAAAWLFGSGLLGLIRMAWRKKTA